MTVQRFKNLQKMQTKKSDGYYAYVCSYVVVDLTMHVHLGFLCFQLVPYQKTKSECVRYIRLIGIAYASGSDAPGSNPARVLRSRKVLAIPIVVIRKQTCIVFFS